MKDLSVILTLSFAIVLFILPSCTSSNSKPGYHHWTEEEKENFRIKCSGIDTFKDLVVQIRGFEDNEFDSILIKEYKDGSLLDSFRVFAWPAQTPYDKRDKDRSAAIQRTMNIKYKYEFILPGQKPYELKDMEMVIWSEETANSDHYACVMGNFTLDGVKFQQTGNPSIYKRDTTNKR